MRNGRVENRPPLAGEERRRGWGLHWHSSFAGRLTGPGRGAHRFAFPARSSSRRCRAQSVGFSSPALLSGGFWRGVHGARRSARAGSGPARGRGGGVRDVRTSSQATAASCGGGRIDKRGAWSPRHFSHVAGQGLRGRELRTRTLSSPLRPTLAREESFARETSQGREEGESTRIIAHAFSSSHPSQGPRWDW